MIILDRIVIVGRLRVDDERASLPRNDIYNDILPDRRDLRGSQWVAGEDGQGDVLRNHHGFRLCSLGSVKYCERTSNGRTQDGITNFVESPANIRVGTVIGVADTKVRLIEVRKTVAQERDKLHDPGEELLISQRRGKGRCPIM